MAASNLSLRLTGKPAPQSSIFLAAYWSHQRSGLEVMLPKLQWARPLCHAPPASCGYSSQALLVHCRIGAARTYAMYCGEF